MFYDKLRNKKKSLESTQNLRKKYLDKAEQSKNPLKEAFYLMCGFTYAINELRLGTQIPKLEENLNAWNTLRNW